MSRKEQGAERFNDLSIEVWSAGEDAVAVLAGHRVAMWTERGLLEETGGPQADRVYRQWLAEKLSSGLLIPFVATVERKVVGSACLWLREIQPGPMESAAASPYLTSVYVEPDFRRLGIGAKLVGEALQWCRLRGYRQVTLHTSRQAFSLYRKLGFKRTNEMRLRLR
ncbi:MAG: GNAT family N-acetyltransferase [Thermoprotei archaeon]